MAAPKPDLRQDYVLVRGPGDQERWPTLHALAARIHALRGERALHLRGFDLAHPDGEQGPSVSIRAGDQREALIGFALFPETRAYDGDDKRARMAKALLDQRPDAHRTFDGETVEFDSAPSGRDGEAGRSARERRTA